MSRSLALGFSEERWSGDWYRPATGWLDFYGELGERHSK